MNKKYLKITIFVILLLFLSVFIVNAQTTGRELEIKYPEIFGNLPENIETGMLPNYIKYIFNFLLATAGLLAMSVLIISGIRYLTSGGNPEQLGKAKDRIKAALFGIIIIFSSWLILSVVNPNLLTLRFPGIEKIPITGLPLNSPSAPPAYANWLWRITEIADSTKILSGQRIKETAKDIYSLTSRCDCMHTQPLCLLQEGNPDEISLNYMEGECKALYCYSANETQPCPGGSEIKLSQKTLIDSLYEILYYKKRAIEERKDSLIKIGNIEKEIFHKEKEIEIEKEYLNKIEGKIRKERQEKFISNLEGKKEKLINEYNLYDELEKELKNLINRIETLPFPIQALASSKNNFSNLPDQCLINVSSKCVGFCQGGGHDTSGCFPIDYPDGCKGKKEGENNPCPIKEIKKQVEEIEFSTGIINATSDKIINIIREIVNL